MPCSFHSQKPVAKWVVASPNWTKTLVKVDHLPKVKREFFQAGSRWVQGSSSIVRWIIKKGATKFQHQPRNEETHDPWRAAHGKRSVGWTPHKKSSTHVHISTNCFSIWQVHFSFWNTSTINMIRLYLQINRKLNLCLLLLPLDFFKQNPGVIRVSIVSHLIQQVGQRPGQTLWCLRPPWKTERY